jgi:hypothetical protein
LFHQGTVICEAEGDAMLYGAALDAELDTGGTELLFTFSGGKQKLPSAIDALVGAGVPVAAIADIDVLREETLPKRIVERLGGDWTEDMEQDRQIVAAAIESSTAASPLISDVSSEIDNALGEDRTARLSEQQTRRIREITRSTDGWRHIRESGGKSAVPRGDARAAIERLIPRLAGERLFVVEVGMVEGWAPELGKHGTRFAVAALEARVHESNNGLRAFVRQVAESLSIASA